MLAFDLPTVWAFIIAFAIFAYVVMDGFDLGIGILFRWIPIGRERDTAMNTIAPVWDGNETWLVLGGGGLMAAFPLAYGTILSALYAPIVAMLLALIFRGVAFEFRWRDPDHRPLWDMAFGLGSTVAAFASAAGFAAAGGFVSSAAAAGGAARKRAGRTRRRAVGLFMGAPFRREEDTSSDSVSAVPRASPVAVPLDYDRSWRRGPIRRAQEG